MQDHKQLSLVRDSNNQLTYLTNSVLSLIEKMVGRNAFEKEYVAAIMPVAQTIPVGISQQPQTISFQFDRYYGLS